jgi:hypothetical protein
MIQPNKKKEDEPKNHVIMECAHVVGEFYLAENELGQNANDNCNKSAELKSNPPLKRTYEFSPPSKSLIMLTFR